MHELLAGRNNKKPFEVRKLGMRGKESLTGEGSGRAMI